MAALNFHSIQDFAQNLSRMWSHFQWSELESPNR